MKELEEWDETLTASLKLQVIDISLSRVCMVEVRDEVTMLEQAG